MAVQISEMHSTVPHCVSCAKPRAAVNVMLRHAPPFAKTKAARNGIWVIGREHHRCPPHIPVAYGGSLAVERWWIQSLNYPQGFTTCRWSLCNKSLIFWFLTNMEMSTSKHAEDTGLSSAKICRCRDFLSEHFLGWFFLTVLIPLPPPGSPAPLFFISTKYDPPQTFNLDLDSLTSLHFIFDWAHAERCDSKSEIICLEYHYHTNVCKSSDRIFCKETFLSPFWQGRKQNNPRIISIQNELRDPGIEPGTSGFWGPGPSHCIIPAQKIGFSMHQK